MVARQIYRRREKPSGVHLTEGDLSLIRGMRLRGDRQHDIAAWFGVNPGRIAEVLSRPADEGHTPATPEALPPAGPYLSARALTEVAMALSQAKAALIAAEQRVWPRT